MTAMNRKVGNKSLLILLVFATVLGAFLFCLEYRRATEYPMGVSGYEGRSVTLYEIRDNHLVSLFRMVDRDGDVPVQYMQLVTNAFYLYISATANETVFNKLWEAVEKAEPLQKWSDLANVSGCISFRGAIVRNVQLTGVARTVRDILKQSKEEKRRQIPFAIGEEERLLIVDVSTNLWHMRTLRAPKWSLKTGKDREARPIEDGGIEGIGCQSSSESF